MNMNTDKGGLRSYFLQSIPPQARESSLMKKGGFDIFEGLVDERGRRLMLEEAMTLKIAGCRSEVVYSDAEDVRGGSPARRFHSARGGDVQDGFYNSEWTMKFLRSICGPSLNPSGQRGTFSYYVQPGDHLAIHRDIETCDVAVITCLLDVPPDPKGDGGRLCMYPTRAFEPLSSIRATPERGAVRIRLLSGQTIVMLGGIVPHSVLPTAPDQHRIVSVLCYRL